MCRKGDNMNNYKLHMLINVFDISPAFLLPIYNKDDEYYFQCLMDHRIRDFTIASMEKFEECKQYTVDENIYKTTGDSALYAIEIADGTHYVYGDSKYVIDYYSGNMELFESCDYFKEIMEDFKKIKNTTNLPSCISNDVSFELISEISLRDKLYKNISSYLYNPVSYSNVPISKPKKRFRKLKDNMTAFSGVKEYAFFENKSSSLIVNRETIFRSQSVFGAWERLKNNRYSYNFESLRPIQCDYKSKAIPLSIQFQMIDYILDQKRGDADIKLLHSYLYYKTKRYLSLDDVYDMIVKDWRIDIIKESLYSPMGSEGFVFNDKYLLGVKRLTSTLFAIIGQSINERNIYFKLLYSNSSDKDLICFIKRIYKDIGDTVNIIPGYNETEFDIFGEEFFEWVAANEQICSIRGTYTIVSQFD